MSLAETVRSLGDTLATLAAQAKDAKSRTALLAARDTNAVFAELANGWTVDRANRLHVSAMHMEAAFLRAKNLSRDSQTAAIGFQRACSDFYTAVRQEASDVQLVATIDSFGNCIECGLPMGDASPRCVRSELHARTAPAPVQRATFAGPVNRAGHQLEPSMSALECGLLSLAPDTIARFYPSPADKVSEPTILARVTDIDACGAAVMLKDGTRQYLPLRPTLGGYSVNAIGHAMVTDDDIARFEDKPTFCPEREHDTGRWLVTRTARAGDTARTLTAFGPFYADAITSKAPNGLTSQENATGYAAAANLPGHCWACGAGANVDDERGPKRYVNFYTVDTLRPDNVTGKPTDTIVRTREELCSVCVLYLDRDASISGQPRKARLGKFQGGHAVDELIYGASLDGSAETCGDVETGRHYTRIDKITAEDAASLATQCGFGQLFPCELEYITQPDGWIVSEDGQGFVNVTGYSTREEMMQAWDCAVSETAEPEDDDSGPDDDSSAEFTAEDERRADIAQEAAREPVTHAGTLASVEAGQAQPVQPDASQAAAEIHQDNMESDTSRAHATYARAVRTADADIITRVRADFRNVAACYLSTVLDARPEWRRSADALKWADVVISDSRRTEQPDRACRLAWLMREARPGTAAHSGGQSPADSNTQAGPFRPGACVRFFAPAAYSIGPDVALLVVRCDPVETRVTHPATGHTHDVPTHLLAPFPHTADDDETEAV